MARLVYLCLGGPEDPEAQGLIDRLGRAGHQVAAAQDLDQAVLACRTERSDLVMVDQRDRGRVALAAAVARLKAEAGEGHLPILALVGQGQGRAEADARAEALLVADDALSRPPAPAELNARIEALLRPRRLIEAILERGRAERAALESRAVADAQTGLRNKVFFLERLNEEYKRASRYNEPLAVVLISLERLRELALCDPRAADRVLARAAQVALRALRQIDVVCRYGPEELGAILPRTHVSGALVCAERLHRDLAAAQLGGERGEAPAGAAALIVASQGIVCFPGKDVAAASDLLRLGSRALERARENGPGTICLHQHQEYIFQPG